MLMQLTLANISVSIPQHRFRRVAAAIARQVRLHFQPEWGFGATLKAIALPLDSKRAPIQKDADAIIYLGESSNDPTTGVAGALGYHSANNRRLPYGFVYLDICREYGEDWPSTLSHEVLELLADPNVVFTISGSHPKDRKRIVYYDLEVCDPTQGDTYRVGDVEVSNFVGRSYYGMTGGSGRTNHMNLPLRAFGVRPNGYLQYETGGTSHQIYGRSVTPRQKAAKKKMGTIRRNARRTERLKHRRAKNP
jgi:hypothetical protein